MLRNKKANMIFYFKRHIDSVGVTVNMDGIGHTDILGLTTSAVDDRRCRMNMTPFYVWIWCRWTVFFHRLTNLRYRISLFAKNVFLLTFVLFIVKQVYCTFTTFLRRINRTVMRCCCWIAVISVLFRHFFPSGEIDSPQWPPIIILVSRTVVPNMREYKVI